MVGSLITRALILVFGYIFPAYDCYKTVELNRPEIEQLRFWCQYWILIALITVFERVADNFVSWLPMYGEAKLAFVVYLWYPKTKGTTYVYDTFFKPYIAKHETEIDRNLLELKTRASDLTVYYVQRGATYAQTRFYEVLQYVAAQSQTPTARPSQQAPAQQRRPVQRAVPTVPAATPGGPPPSAPPPPQQPPQVPASSVRNHVKEEPTGAPSAAAPTAQPHASHVASTAAPDAAAPAVPGTDEVQVNTADAPEVVTSVVETIMDEAIRMTRGRLRKRFAGAGAGAGPSTNQ